MARNFGELVDGATSTADLTFEGGRSDDVAVVSLAGKTCVAWTVASSASESTQVGPADTPIAWGASRI